MRVSAPPIAVTDVSGRGVGMDVVKQRLVSLNGTMHVSLPFRAKARRSPSG